MYILYAYVKLLWSAEQSIVIANIILHFHYMHMYGMIGGAQQSIVIIVILFNYVEQQKLIGPIEMQHDWGYWHEDYEEKR